MDARSTSLVLGWGSDSDRLVWDSASPNLLFKDPIFARFRQVSMQVREKRSISHEWLPDNSVFHHHDMEWLPKICSTGVLIEMSD